ncbi:MAG: amino acid ABC transporter permease [Rhodobacteraceae bacterium]|nr:amino acid ABC transporter permease [Paracoccaceae bacterium]
MVPAAAPPMLEGTVIGWLRANLFNSWLNSALSVVFVTAVAYLLWQFIPWAFKSSWTANSLVECRQQIKAGFGEDVSGACWAVIRERYLQLIYGFYPADLYWRPNLTFVLMLIALAPVLFPTVSRKLLLFSCMYPFLGYWLLWGGSIWGVALVVAELALAFYLLSPLTARFGLLITIVGVVLATVLWWLFAVAPLQSLFHGILPLGLRAVPSNQFGGFTLSTIIGVTGIVASLPLGILWALGRRSDMLIVRSISVGFIELIRGVPLITLLFVASTLLNIFLPPGTSFDIILRVVIVVTLFSSGYVAEVIRGGLAALPVGQYEASDALGLDYWKSMRLVVLPQALKISIPGIVSSFIGLFKDTTLVSIIGLLDPLGLSNAIRADSAWNGIVWELYVFIAVMFFAFCFAMSRYSMHLERRLETGH